MSKTGLWIARTALDDLPEVLDKPPGKHWKPLAVVFKPQDLAYSYYRG